MLLLDPIARRVVGFLALVALLCFVLAGVAMCSRAQVKRDLDVAEEVGKQLDGVAKKTPEIRKEQKAKEDEVRKIEGADERLPDGFGANLERLRNK